MDFEDLLEEDAGEIGRREDFCREDDFEAPLDEGFECERFCTEDVGDGGVSKLKGGCCISASLEKSVGEGRNDTDRLLPEEPRDPASEAIEGGPAEAIEDGDPAMIENCSKKI